MTAIAALAYGLIVGLVIGLASASVLHWRRAQRTSSAMLAHFHDVLDSTRNRSDEL